MGCYKKPRWAVLAWMLVIVMLVGCDIVEEASGPGAAGSETTVAQPTEVPAQPTRRSSAPLSDAQIGGASVARAQAQPTPTLIAADEVDALSEYERVINNVYRRTINGVVNLSGGRGTGSGFIIDQEGHIITNHHVIAQMQEIYITFADRSTARGRLVGTFPEGDIAVVRAEEMPAGATPVEFGDSGALQVGQIVVAVGSPLGLEQTVTSGIVSALNRSITEISRQQTEDTSLEGLIQTDAAINPGNSGGPLFDSRGRVIGMNTLIATRAQTPEAAGNIGLGFAVPVNRVQRVARQIIETGEYNRPRLQVTVFQVVPQIAEELGLSTTSGVMLGEVVQGGASDRAGLRGATRGVTVNGIQVPVDGDIITEINGAPVRSIGDLRNVIETQADPGDTVSVTFIREGVEQTTEVTLE
jgi:S1-C subfamily serine protease